MKDFSFQSTFLTHNSFLPIKKGLYSVGQSLNAGRVVSWRRLFSFANYFTILFTFALFGNPSVLKAQSQAQFVTPPFLSACNTDTICVNVENLQGSKSVTYVGNVTLEVDVPAGALVEYIAGSVSSVPAGATATSYVNNKLTISMPLPAFGTKTKVWFIVRPDCNITSLAALPSFSGKITYPPSYPIASELFNSALLNTGKAALSHVPYGGDANYVGGTYFNAKPEFGGLFRVITEVRNTGYGNATELTLTTIHDNDITLDPAYLMWVYRPDDGYPYTVISPVTTLPYNATQTIRTYKITSINMGADGKLGPGETLRLDEWLNAPSQCATYDSKIAVNYTCGAGQPVCAKADTLRPRINIAAGTPKLDATLISAEDPDGCPDKLVKYKIKNNGVGNAAPTGNAYDVDLNINFGGGLLNIKNLTLNGIPVPAANLFPSLANSNNFKIKLKDFMTTDPDGAGGISDIDGDGFFDDMLVAAETEVAFNFTMPCKDACGANLYYNMGSNNTFTDFCRVLDGVTNTPLKEFGFQQVQPIEQKRKVDFGVLTTGQSKTDTAKFAFQYKAFNVNFTNATVQLKINYRDKMELDPTSIRINDIAPTNTPVLQGSGALFASVPFDPINDNDSTYVVDLTAAEIATLFDGTPDSLKYVQTYYGCDTRQNTKTQDNWQLCVKMKPTLCTDGSEPCTYDLACKKPWSYSAGQGCGTIPCYVDDYELKRISKTGYTDVTEANAITAIDSKRMYAGDTVQFKIGGFINGFRDIEPNGTYSLAGRPYHDMRANFGLRYTKPKGSNLKYNIWNFLPTYSTVCVRQRTPDAVNKNIIGTLGAVIKEVPLLLEDFGSDGGNKSATTQGNNSATQYLYPGPYGSTPDGPGYYCLLNPNVWIVNGICPAVDGFRYDAAGGYSNITSYRYENIAGDKAIDLYYVNFGKALARAGWFGNPGDTSYYYEIKTRWKMNPDFPFDNSNDFSFTDGGFTHIGNSQTVDYYSPGSTGVASCNASSETGLVVTKNHYISNPREVYNASCGLRAHNKVFFSSYEGNYFDNGTGEVRVPLKIDSIVVDVPTEYAISNISLDYNQSCAVQTSTAITASVPTGHVVFTNGATDFPRADDCSGNKTAYDLSYDLTKTGSAAPTLYRLPIKIYTRDEFNKVKILIDTASISEDNPDLVLTPLTPILQVQDAGACQAAQFDFVIQNNTLYDAPNSYFAIESTVGTTPLTVTDGGNVYPDPIEASDVSTYGGANKFVKLGTVKAGDKRIVRVFANTALCTDNLKIYTDFGCAYPASLSPDLASATLDQATATYEAVEPALLSRLISNISVQNLCDNKTIEIEVRNARLTNINKLLAGFKFPSNVKYVAGTAQIKYPLTGTYANIAAADITQPNADSLDINLNNSVPFNTSCGLVGADTSTLNTFRIKLDVEFMACPANNIDQVFYRFSGQNYCGKVGTNSGAAAINYIGSSGTQNNYALGYSPVPIKICSTVGVAQPVSDNLFIKNLGGYGTASGLTSGFDSLVVSLVATNTGFTVSNWAFAAPFNAPFFSTDPQGNATARFLVPAGIAIGDSISLPMTYDVTPSVNKLCLTAQTPPICFHGQFSSPVLLVCVAKAIDCGATQKSLKGSTLSFRNFECCYGSIGDYVYTDIDNSNTQTAGDLPMKDVKVYLLDDMGVKLDSALTDMNGLYKFDSVFAGTYSIQFVAPVGRGFVTQNVGTTDTDSDAGTDGKTGTYTVNTLKPVGDPDRDITTVDAGIRFCIPPTITSVAATSATCTNGVANNNAAINVTGIANMTSYAYRTNATDSLWANTATTSTASSINLTGLANPSVSTTYTVRVWGIDTTCYNDTTVVLTPSVCPLCSITATFTQGSCNSNGTNAISTDDYFTVTVSGVTATNGGTSGKYEVLLNGSVLNTGGMAYGTPVTVGASTPFKSDGTTTYTLTVRDMDITTCTATFTTTASASCSTVGCKPVICLPVTVTKF
jgi:SdrD B-like domain